MLLRCIRGSVPCVHSVVVVGAGIVGLAVSRQLTRSYPGVSVTVVDKEPTVAAHQTSHNSGVVHAGLYYRPGSLKATLCRRGVGLLRDYCADRAIPYEEVGKLVVAADRDEVPALRQIEQNAVSNGVPGLRWLDGAEMAEVEPHIRGSAALHSPRTAITDFAAVARAYAQDVLDAGGRIVLGATVTSIRQSAGTVRVGTTREELRADHVILCAGLHSDRVAALAGDQDEPAIVPFRGEYLDLVPTKACLVNGLVYPVPDPSYPFLGVHLTRHVHGGVDIGPNAVLAFSREGYRRRDVNLADLGQTLGWPGFRRLARQHWRMGLQEMALSASRRRFVEQARRYLPDLQPGDVIPAAAGVRAQALDRDGSLVDDFRIHHLDRVTAVRNAPSPGATSSLAIAEHIVADLGAQAGMPRPAVPDALG
jgi:L-2-hydroxyglutarate oxidase LhgO